MNTTTSTTTGRSIARNFTNRGADYYGDAPLEWSLAITRENDAWIVTTDDRFNSERNEHETFTSAADALITYAEFLDNWSDSALNDAELAAYKHELRAAISDARTIAAQGK